MNIFLFRCHYFVFHNDPATHNNEKGTARWLFRSDHE